jgi:uncharacterized membrane protein
VTLWISIRGYSGNPNDTFRRIFTKPATQLFDNQRRPFLTYGVFDITLTRLAADLKLPADLGAALPSEVEGLLPRLLAYLFALVMVANQWIFHHRSNRLVQFAEGALVVLTFAHLLFITLIPFTAGLAGGNPTSTVAAACFSANTLLLSLAAWALVSHLTRAPLLRSEGADPASLVRVARVWAYIASGFGAAHLVGLFSVYLAFAVWLIWPLSAMWIVHKPALSVPTQDTSP